MQSKDDLANDLVWGAKAIASALGVDTRTGFYLLEKGLVPAKKVGRAWVASRRQLREHLTPAPVKSEAA